MDNHKQSSPENIQKPRTAKIILGMAIGGIIGAALLLAVTWCYMAISRKSSGTLLYPIYSFFDVIGLYFVAWVGLVSGALLSLFFKKWHNS